MTKTKINHRLLIVVLLLIEVCSALEVSMIYASLPTLNREFGSPSSVSWVITSCMLVGAVAAALCGRLGDLLGRRKLLLIVLALCASGSLISALSSTLAGVIVGAAIQGVSGAVMALCFGVARRWLPAEKVPFAVGVIVAAAALGAGTGLVLGGWIIDRFSWNVMFMVSSSYAALCVLLTVIFLPKEDRPAGGELEHIDLWRGVLFAPAIAGLLLSLNLFPRLGADWRLLILGLASTCLLAYWIKHQLNAPTPLINLRLLANRKIITGYLCMALVALGGLQIGLLLSMFLQQPAWTGAGFALTAAASGLMMLPSNLVGLFASPWSGRLAGRHSARLALMIAAALMAIGWLSLMLSHSNLWVVGSLIVVAAFGFNMSYAAIPNLLIEASPSGNTSEITGISAVMRTTFMAIGSQIIGFVLGVWSITSADGAMTSPSAEAYQILFGWIGVCSVLCFILAWSLPKKAAP